MLIMLPSVLWHRCLCDRYGIPSVKTSGQFTTWGGAELQGDFSVLQNGLGKFSAGADGSWWNCWSVSKSARKFGDVQFNPINTVLTSGARHELCARGVPSWWALLVMYSITSMLSMALQALTTGYAIDTILQGVRHRALSVTTRGRGSSGVNQTVTISQSQHPNK